MDSLNFKNQRIGGDFVVKMKAYGIGHVCMSA